jgi:hypothetical protein
MSKFRTENFLLGLKTFVIRQSPRLWWRRKTSIVLSHHPSKPLSLAVFGYIFFSPELDTFTYRIRNQSELEAEVSKLIPSSRESPKLLQEFNDLRLQGSKIFARIIHLPHAKFHPKFGRHFLAYSLVRHFKPNIVIESGIKFGLGSYVFKSANLLNKQSNPELNPKYIGMDIYAGSGHYTKFDSNCTKSIGNSLNYLTKMVANHEKFPKVFFVSDSVPGEQIQEELLLAAQLTDDQLIFVFNHNWIRDIFLPSGFDLITKQSITECAIHPFYPGRTSEVLVISKSSKIRRDANHSEQDDK